MSTPEKVSKDSSTAKVQVMGILSGITNDKFVVKLVDNEGNETFPKVDVSGEVNSTKRTVSFEIPKNTTTKDKEYTVYVSSTGSKTDFAKATVKITQEKSDTEDPKPETPEEEKIAMIQEVTTSNLPAKDAIAKIKVAGQIKNIPSGKFIVKLVDEKGKESYPEIEVTGDASKAFRFINIKVPENTTDKGKTYEIYATSTGKKDKVFKSDVKITQQAGKAEDPKPETPEEEKIAMIQEVTTSNLPAKDAIAKIKVAGQIKNIPSGKFIVKLVDEKGKESYPEIEVTGDASKAFRFINIKVPENTTDKGKTYEIYATSTGKKDKVFKSDVKITQQAGKAEDPKPETPEEEKVFYEEILPSYAHASKDGKIIEVGFNEEIEEIFEDSLKAGISIDRNADGSYEKLESNDTVELSDKKFVVTLEKPLDVKGLGFNKAKIKINQGVFRKKGTENLNSCLLYTSPSPRDS